MILRRNEQIQILEIEGRKIIQTIDESGNQISYACFMPDDFSILYVVNGYNVCQYHLERKEEIFRFIATSAEIKSLKISPDCKLLFIGDQERRLTLWNIDKMENFKSGLNGMACSLQFSSDSKSLFILTNYNKMTEYAATTGIFSNEKKVELYKIKPYLENNAFTVKHLMPIFRNVGPYISSAYFQKLWTLYDQKQPQNLQAIALTSNSHYLALLNDDGTIKIWDTLNEKKLLSFSVETTDLPLEKVKNCCLAFSYPSQTSEEPWFLAIAFNPKNTKRSPMITVWKLNIGKSHADCISSFKYPIEKLSDKSYWFTQIQFSKNNLYLFTTNEKDDAINMWNIDQQILVKKFKDAKHAMKCFDVHYKDQGFLLASASYKVIHLWDENANKILYIDVLHSIENVQFSPNGRLLVVSVERGTAFYVWELYDAYNRLIPRLLWRLPHRLECENLQIHSKGAIAKHLDLSEENRSILKQYGAREI